MEQSYYILNGGENGATYAMTNLVYQTTKTMADMINEMKIVFSIATVVFGAFAMLMLFNFITVSIQTKKKEIGILRAVGARRIDVFKIFITEALFITLTCFLLSTVFSWASCIILNVQTVETGVKISLFNYGIKNILMSFGMVLGVSAIATGIPVIHTSRKSPVESIRSL
jgi:ABC-type antimicrobial peptide transport system permease subunit